MIVVIYNNVKIGKNCLIADLIQIKEGLRWILHKLDLKPYFKVIETKEDVGHFKPSSEGLFIVAKETGSTKNELMLIEDDTFDIEADKRASVKVLHVNGIIASDMIKSLDNFA
jgi:beta-phosphoglucomutase-like phosphatase (HAD superfamily)